MTVPRHCQKTEEWVVPQLLEWSSHSLAYEITQLTKTKHTTFHGHLTLLCDGPHPVECPFLWIRTNPPLTYHCVSHWIFAMRYQSLRFIRFWRVKAMVLPVVMYGCESWTLKKAEHWRIDALELWCWRRLLRVPWTARISNQFILKEISPEYSLEELMLKLKLQYFAHLIQRTNSLEKTLILGKIEGRMRRGQQRMR